MPEATTCIDGLNLIWLAPDTVLSGGNIFCLNPEEASSSLLCYPGGMGVPERLKTYDFRGQQYHLRKKRLNNPFNKTIEFITRIDAYTDVVKIESSALSRRENVWETHVKRGRFANYFDSDLDVVQFRGKDEILIVGPDKLARVTLKVSKDTRYFADGLVLNISKEWGRTDIAGSESLDYGFYPRVDLYHMAQNGDVLKEDIYNWTSCFTTGCSLDGFSGGPYFGIRWQVFRMGNILAFILRHKAPFARFGAFEINLVDTATGKASAGISADKVRVLPQGLLLFTKSGLGLIGKV